MRRFCEICNEEFDTKSSTRIYCYQCSGDSTRKDNQTRLGGKCCKCGYNKCIDALEFHHENQDEKEFKLGSGNTMAWREYKAEAMKCILVCSNCHKEIHAKIGYVFNK